MYNNKVIVAVIGVLFIYVQIGDALNCYSCNSTKACEKPSKITCSVKNSNETIQYLSNFLINVKKDVKNEFYCFRQKYTQNIGANMTYKGCIFRDIHSCDLQLNRTYAYLTKESCSECIGDFCNPAGTFSSNSFIIVLSLVGVLIAMTSFS